MADILICGMPMPRQGLKVVAIHSNGHVYADTSDPGFLHKIADIIELPEHGDLIDRVAFRAEMDNHYPFGRGTQRRHGEADAAKSTIINMLATAPVVVQASKEETE